MSSSVLQLENYSKRAIFVKLLDIEYRSVWNKKLAPFDPEWNKSDTEPGWIISKRHEDDLIHLLKECRRSRKPRKEDQKYSRAKKHEESEKEDSRSKDEVRSDKDKHSKKHSHSRSDSSSSSESERSGSEESDDSSEDELIQQTLTRKLKYESSQKIIDEEGIENSDLEDVISMCRRMRYLLQANRQLSEKIRELEKKLEKQ